MLSWLFRRNKSDSPDRVTASFIQLINNISRRCANKPEISENLQAFLIGMPVRETYTGSIIETCMHLRYEESEYKWRTYVYSNEEEQEDKGKYPIIEIWINGVIELSEEENKTWKDLCNRLRFFYPEAFIMKM